MHGWRSYSCSCSRRKQQLLGMHCRHLWQSREPRTAPGVSAVSVGAQVAAGAGAGVGDEAGSTAGSKKRVTTATAPTGRWAAAAAGMRMPGAAGGIGAAAGTNTVQQLQKAWIGNNSMQGPAAAGADTSTAAAAGAGVEAGVRQRLSAAAAIAEVDGSTGLGARIGTEAGTGVGAAGVGARTGLGAGAGAGEVGTRLGPEGAHLSLIGVLVELVVTAGRRRSRSRAGATSADAAEAGAGAGQGQRTRSRRVTSATRSTSIPYSSSK